MISNLWEDDRDAKTSAQSLKTGGPRALELVDSFFFFLSEQSFDCHIEGSRSGKPLYPSGRCWANPDELY